MDLLENVREGLKSIQANMLRSVLTAAIVAFGISSLVGSLTAVDGIEHAVTTGLSSLGVNTFDVRSKENHNEFREGVTAKVYPRVTLTEMNQFVKEFRVPSTVSLSTNLSGIAEVKHGSKKTNPNVGVNGVNTGYVTVKGLELLQGRNLSTIEVNYGTPTAILGYKIYTSVFKEREQAVGQNITMMGTQFRVVGVLAEKGQLSEDNYDNMVIIPIVKANQMAQGRGLYYDLAVNVTDPTQLDFAMGEGTGLMRKIRHDQVGHENSFELQKSETLDDTVGGIMTALHIAGFGVGFITLLGASIALMNIMLVSVTERTREVGVRKALGATPRRIRQQFVIEAIVVCLLGGIAGVILGTLFGNFIASFMGIEGFVMPWSSIFLGIIVCIVVGLSSGYYPAYKASKVDPIESLRFE